jgi:hypothetical protein
MNFFWLICIMGGIFAMAAAWRNWGWFFFHRFARTLAKVFGRTAARVVYAALGAFLLVTGLYLGWTDRWALTEPFGCKIVVKGSFPGRDARWIAAALAAPVDAQCNQIPTAKFVLSESRGDGSYRTSVVFLPKENPEAAKIQVANAAAVAFPLLPRAAQLNINIETPPRSGGRVAIAVVGKTDDASETALRDFARAVQQRLVNEHALADPIPLDEQLPPHGGAPSLIVFVNRRPAVRIIGFSPSGKFVPWAAARCVALAEAERKKRPDREDFEIINLGTL